MENSEVVYLYLDDIIPNRFQPREVFDEQALKELAVSIKEHGVIQPIIVRKVENKYEIIAGERRYKASTMAGLTKIPAIVKNLDDKESSKVALIENLQRKDLSPIEEARTYQKILELEPGMTQEELASTMGKTQSAVSNKIRLLVLPDEVQDALLNDKISERHARSLLNINDKNNQIRMLDKVIAEKMTVRELDKEIKEMNDLNNNNVGVSVENNEVKEESIPTTEVNNESVNIVPTNPVNGDIISNNPTVVDIDKIRMEAQDINAPVEHSVDVKDLMKDTSVKEDTGFKFVPSEPEKVETSPVNEQPSNNLTNQFGNIEATPSTNVPLSNENSILNFGSNNEAAPSTLENNFNKPLPSNISNPYASSFNINNLINNNKRDVMPAVSDIKNIVKEVESKGYKVVTFENDNDNSYQIVINIDKNN